MSAAWRWRPNNSYQGSGMLEYVRVVGTLNNACLDANKSENAWIQSSEFGFKGRNARLAERKHEQEVGNQGR